jgi:hypothetical protein
MPQYGDQVKWVPCHDGMARPWVADGENGLHIWKVGEEVLAMQWPTAEGHEPPCSGVRLDIKILRKSAVF